MTIKKEPMPKGTGEEVLPVLLSYMDADAWKDIHVEDDLRARIKQGTKEYGEPLKTHNGRSVYRDLYEELLDASLYAVQAYMEFKDKTIELDESVLWIAKWHLDVIRVLLTQIFGLKMYMIESNVSYLGEE